MKRKYSIAFATLDRPACLGRALASIETGGWPFASKIVIDSFSTPANLAENIRLCMKAGFNLYGKKRRTGTANSYNLAILYSEARHVIIAADDIIFPPDGRWLAEIEKGFDAGYYKVEIPALGSDAPTLAWAIDKQIITQNMWLDERFTSSGCEDNDYLIRLREKLGTDDVCPERNYHDRLLLHFEEPSQPPHWKSDPNRVENREFFLKKWRIRRDIVANVAGRANLSDEELIPFVVFPGQVERQIVDIDHYPVVTLRYRTGDFSALREFVDPIAGCIEASGCSITEQ